MWRNLAEILFISRSSQWKRQNIFYINILYQYIFSTKEFCDKIKISIKAIFLKILKNCLLQFWSSGF